MSLFDEDTANSRWFRAILGSGADVKTHINAQLRKLRLYPSVGCAHENDGPVHKSS
jgi:hypothetical protein